jgi:glycosyltransferase involved in cell wall biosynthesis
VYKRLHYLENVLKAVGLQDYPNIELLVSDNGLHGTTIPEMVDRFYGRPYTFRQNLAIVSISTHFNQLVNAASGEYFVLLADDDEISPNYVSDLVHRIEQHPDASAGISVQETMDESGRTLRTSKRNMPPVLSGIEFIRAVWGTHEFAYESLSTLLARTEEVRACGGYPDFWKGHANDDALLIKLCLDRRVVLSNECSFRKRFEESSHGYAAPIQDLARGVRDFLKFLNSDSKINQYARLHPAEWGETKSLLTEMAWKTYYFRWADMYKKRLSRLAWVKAAYALPYIPQYYKAVTESLIEASVSGVWAGVKERLPWVYRMVVAAKGRRS